MKKIKTICIGLMLLSTFIPSVIAEFDQKNNTVFYKDENGSFQCEKCKEKILDEYQIERPFNLSTSGVSCPMRFMGTMGWAFMYHMFTPWPDQMYFTLFGFINYENGTTTIIDTNTGESIQREGPHKVIFYKFYGPTSSVQDYNVSFEGNAMFACAIGGK